MRQRVRTEIFVMSESYENKVKKNLPDNMNCLGLYGVSKGMQVPALAKGYYEYVGERNTGQSGMPFEGVAPGPITGKYINNIPSLPFSNGAGVIGNIVIEPRANLPGQPMHPEVIAFAQQIAGVFGKTLHITCGTNHRQFVSGTNRQSSHWTGWGMDFGNYANFKSRGTPSNPNPNLIRLGQAALIAAGMDQTKALAQTHGVFNINGYNILFNTMSGGDHYTHLHVGLSKSRQH